MKPIKFPEQNTIIAEDQPEYIPLPAHVDPASFGTVTSCWQFSLWERIRVFFGAKLYWQQLTWNQPLQPVKPTIGHFPIGE